MHARILGALTEVPAARVGRAARRRQSLRRACVPGGPGGTRLPARVARAGCLRTWRCSTATTLVAAAPGYRKRNSHGEFVFDHAWAQAYAQHGLTYFPKWLGAVPYSPVTGPRLLARDDDDARVAGRGDRRDRARSRLVVGARELPSRGRSDGLRRRLDPAHRRAVPLGESRRLARLRRLPRRDGPQAPQEHPPGTREGRARRRSHSASCTATKPATPTSPRCTASTCRPSTNTATRRR